MLQLLMPRLHSCLLSMARMNLTCTSCLESQSAWQHPVTHLTMNRGKLYHRGKPMKAVGLKEALENFISWLQDMKEEILFAHNGRAFDSKRIVYSLLRHDLLYPFQDSVIGFVDTLLLFKKVLPLREKYSQQSLV